MGNFTVAVDLGQVQDYSALCVLERVRAGSEDTFHARHLARWPLGTAYPAVVADTAALLARPPLRGPSGRASLVIDLTGVGRAVGDLFRAAGAPAVGVTITGGDSVTRGDDGSYRVPKREIASGLQALLQTGRLKIAPELPEARTLIAELLAFRAKINIATGNDSFEAWRSHDHDDLVLSVGIAAWWAMRPKLLGATIPGKSRSPGFELPWGTGGDRVF